MRLRVGYQIIKKNIFLKFQIISDLLRSRISASPSIFTSDEYRAWLRRAPSSSAIHEQMAKTNRDIFNHQRAQRFSCSAENIHDVLRNVTNSIISQIKI